MTLRRDIVRQAVDKVNERGELVFLGNSAGIVEVYGESGKVWVTDTKGNVFKVWNTNVPLIPRHPAWVKMFHGKLQIMELWNIYQFMYPRIAPHRALHEWGPLGVDIIRVFGPVWMPWKVEPISSFTVRVYREAYLSNSGWLAAGTQDIDLTSHVPSTGTQGRYVLLSVATDGTITITNGTPVTNYIDLDAADIPSVPTDDKPIFAIRLYHGQTELTYNYSTNDFTDLRHLQTGGGSSYSLPTASGSVKGGIKIGDRLTMTGDVLSADVQTGGHVIENEGTPVTQRANLDFVGASVDVSDDAGNDRTIITISNDNNLYVDQSGGTGDTYGVLGGAINGINHVYTVSRGTYTSGTLTVYLNGQLLTQGSAEDWQETAPGSGTFTLTVAPSGADKVTAIYGYLGIGGGGTGFQTLSDGSSIAWNLAQGSGRVTLGGNRTISNPSNLAAGQQYFLCVVQDSTGSRTLAFDTAYKFPSNNRPTLSAYKNTEDMLTFRCDGTYLIFEEIIHNITNTDPTLTYITNLACWLEARLDSYSDNGVTPCVNLDPVYTTLDQSGNSKNLLQTVLGNRMIYRTNILNGRASWRFDGASQFGRIAGLNLGDSFSIYMVLVPHTVDPIGLFDGAPSNTPSTRNYGNGIFDDFNAGPTVDFTLPETSPVLLNFILTQTSNRVLKYYKNNVLIDTQTMATTDSHVWDDPCLGAINLGSAGYYDGDLLAHLAYSESNSDAHRIDIAAYLKSVYGIA